MELFEYLLGYEWTTLPLVGNGFKTRVTNKENYISSGYILKQIIDGLL